MSDFAKNLRYYRKQKRLSQAELAKALNYGVDKVTQVDLGFLKDEFSKEELAEDVKAFAKLVTPLIEAEFVKVIFKGNLDEVTLHYDIYQEMLDGIQNMNILICSKAARFTTRLSKNCTSV